MKRTPLFERHAALGAKLVDFAGWEMPIQYSGVVDEYRHVRQSAGLFDVSHMGRLRVSGAGAVAFLQRVTTNNVAAIPLLGSHYSMVCNPQGGIKDDIFIYRTKPEEYLLCVNASNREKIAGWLSEHQTPGERVTFEDVSAALAQLALQGPATPQIIAQMGLTDAAAIKPRQCLPVRFHDQEALISRTGYTGEVGYELYVPASRAAAVWDDVMRCGQAAGLKAAGLGARDLLRLEVAYLLYGNDISEETTPLEANAAWVVDLGKGDFVGRRALEALRARGLSRRLVAFELEEKAVPRHGFPMVSRDGEPIGEVTSGNLSPLLQKGIGLGYVSVGHAEIGSKIAIDIRGKRVGAVVVKPPFYRRPRAA